MSSVNKVILIGNVGKDPEIRTTQGGDRIANFSIATSERWKDKGTGEQQEKTEWHKVVIFNDRIADVVEKYVKKGSKVYVEGSLQTRKWTDKDGVDRYSTEIVVGKFKGELTLLGDGNGGGSREGGSDRSASSDSRSKPPARTNGRTGGGQSWEAGADFDDDIPF